jgi:hypothetical protein
MHGDGFDWMIASGPRIGDGSTSFGLGACRPGFPWTEESRISRLTAMLTVPIYQARRDSSSPQVPDPRSTTEGSGCYSHSMVPGGLLVTSKATRFTPGTSATIREAIRSTTSYGSRAQSAVMASSLVTARITTGFW